MNRMAIQSKVATVSTTVIVMDDFSFTSGYVNTARGVLVSAWDHDVLLTFDGTDPSIGTGLGHPISANTWYEIEGIENIPRIKLVRAGATDALVTITLLR